MKLRIEKVEEVEGYFFTHAAGLEYLDKSRPPISCSMRWHDRPAPRAALALTIGLIADGNKTIAFCSECWMHFAEHGIPRAYRERSGKHPVGRSIGSGPLSES